MNSSLKYIAGYPQNLIEQVSSLIESGRFVTWFEKRYPERHQIQSEKALFDYTMDIKQRYMKKTAPISKVIWDNKIHLINNALGLHTYVSRSHGGKLKSKNEIRIASVFKHAPEPLLRMLVVHELAHIKEKEHDKSFYQLCCHMEPDYHQLEFDARLFMIYQELKHEARQQ
ncbi:MULTISPECIES: M48 family metallopeptidase [Vibrio]|uniref:M48 family peptidase n=1 Tax=Vibrio mediterranei TaxID=689 RepID=A0A2S9ZK43_9VIBR|nr:MULTISPECIES: M48 family metallopeptidase [Vibrio]AYV20196.1 M48 family peptidase [Vibrio mediterranei]KFA98812.1 metal-dependent hydrolase [Vibrio sp. ER1A]MCG9661931.1 M48 family metallopeptidase [Vibrio mediterranei]MCG9787351.1 M48 family metallopeptidase [Vibrio mediterranei]MCY9855538.1 M48 family metallopeptidase [Vibrio mediterranei]